MSRGLGRIEQAIVTRIERMKRGSFPDPVLISSWDVVGDAFRPQTIFWVHWTPTRAQRKAMIRAMHSFVAKFPQYALMGGMGRKPLYLYELDDPKSVAWAEASVHERQPVALYDVQRLVGLT